MKDTQTLDYIKKSFELKNQGFYKPAIEMLYKALVLDTDNVEILAQLAHLYKLLNNFDRAQYYIEKVLETDKNHLDCLFLLEDIHLIQNNLHGAKEISKKIYEIQPTNKNLAGKINIINKLQDFEAVKEMAHSLEEFNDEVLYEIACAYYDNYEFQKALELLELGYSKNNKNEKILFKLGKIYFDHKDYEKSKKVFADLEEINKSAEVMNYLGLFSMEDKDVVKAIEHFLAAQKADENNANYAYNLASAYFLSGWLDEAENFFNKAVCLDSENIDYRYALAYLYYQKQLYDKASLEVDLIKTIEQNHPLANVLGALILAKKGDLLKARNQLEDITKNSEADDFAYSALSQVYKELSSFNLAREAIKQALEIKPESLEYLSELTEMEIRAKNYEKAKELAQKLLEINKKYLYAHIALAKIYFETGDYAKAFDAAQDVIELDPNCAEGYYYNALALFEQKDMDFAIESLKKAISLDLNNASLYLKMSEFYQDLGDFEHALAWAKEASDIDERNYKNKWLCARLAAQTGKHDQALKLYSQSYRMASADKDLCKDYANYLTSQGKEKQAAKILK